jgi:hypothetical protein
MKLKQRMILLGMSLLLACGLTLAETDPSITYQNQRGSTLILTWRHDSPQTGKLSGTFNTAVGNCKTDIGVPMPVAGYFNGNAIAITVNFPHCKQVVAMTGNVSSDLKTIHMLWMDANQAKDPQGKDWNSNILGADIYQKAAK